MKTYTHGRRASGSSIRHRIEEQHREVLARGIDPGTDKVRDLQFLRRYQALVQRILEAPAEALPDLRVVASEEPGPSHIESSPQARRHEGRELIIFRRLAEASGYGFCVADEKGIITYANRALCRLLAAHDPEDLIGRSLTACYPEEVQENFAIGIIPTVVKHGQWVGELPLRSASGQRTPTLQNIFLVHGEVGAQPYLGNLIIDITDRQRAEDALRQSEERYRGLIENLQDAVFSIDAQGTILFVSKAIEAFTGFRPEELVGRSFREFLFQDDRVEVERQFEELLQDLSHGPWEYRILTKSVDVRWVRSSSRPIVVDGKITGVTGILTDITARKWAEQALQKSEEKFSQAFRRSPESLFIYRIDDGEIIEANEGFQKATGLQLSDILGRPVHTLQYWAHSERRDAFDLTLLESGVADSEEGALRANDGRLIPVWTSARRIELGGVACAICVARPIGDRRRLEESIRIQRDLSLSLRTASGLEEAVRLCVEAAVALAGMDVGAFYLLDRDTGALDLLYATGLSPEFQSRAKHLPAASKQTRLITGGQPVRGVQDWWEDAAEEGLRALVVLPVIGTGQVIGALGVASHIRTGVPARVETSLEAVAAQVGSAVAQAQTAAALRDMEQICRALSASLSEGVAWHRLIYNDHGEPVDYELVEANPAFERIVGAKREALIGKRSREVYGGDQPFCFEPFCRVALLEGQLDFKTSSPAGGPRLHVRAFSPRRGHFIAVIRPADTEGGEAVT